MKILILRFSSIGDIVLTTPVVRAVMQQLKAEVHFVAKKNFEDVIRNNPYIAKKIYFEKNTDEIAEELLSANYDYVIDLQKNLRSMLLTNRLGVKSYTFNKLNLRKWITVNFKTNVLPPVHIVDRYMLAVKSLGVANDGGGLDYFITPEDELALNRLPDSHRRKYYGWVIGAKHFTKRLPFEKLVSIAKKINGNIVLLGGKEDFETGKRLAAITGEKVFNACGMFSLNESAALVKSAEKVITHDTGLMHIAAAFRKEIISVWGNTIPEFGMYPYYGSGKNKAEILEVKGLSCRPCSKIGFEKCPRGHFKCMREIDERIFESL